MRNVFKSATIALVVLLGLTLGGVVSAQKGDEPKKEEAKKLDLPWTTEQAKKSWKKGTSVKFKTVTKVMGKEEVGFELSEFTDTNDTTYKTKDTSFDAEGKAKGEAKETEKKWADWDKSFDFTDKDTKITEETIKVAAGEYKCKVYTQTKEENGATSKAVVYFVADKPGYIAKFTMEGGSGDSAWSYSMELVETKEG